MKNLLKKLQFTILPLIVGLAFAFVAAPAHAAYTDNNLIDDSVFLNSSTMSQADIQNFLNSKGGAIASYSAPNTDPGQNNRMMSAAEIIYFTSQYIGINPRVIMATLQKEQSLITDPNPSAGKYDYAMGYGCPDSGRCSGSSGFYYQVVTGAWQLRLNFERAGGSSAPWTSPSGRTWGTSIGYACPSATRYYSTGLYAGRSVTFYSDNGTAYKTFNLDNRGTASLYCYTPHAYNPSGVPQYYSGSYNFVASFESWWGSTRVPSYSWQYAGQTNSPGNSLVATQKSTWTLSALNTGSATWVNSGPNPVRLGTNRSQDRVSVFCSLAWPSCARAADLNEASVAPGQVGTFTINVQAPTTPGTYNEYFTLLAEGITWMNDPGLFWTTIVSSANLSGTTLSNTLPSSLAAQATATGVVTIRNDSNVAWYKDGRYPVKLGTYAPTDRQSPFYTSGWLSPTRPSLMNEDTVPPGQSATFTVPIKGPGVGGDYTENYSIVSEGYKWLYQTIASNITVTGGASQPPGVLTAGQSLTTNQLMISADGRYRLVLQGDGNLVLYSPNRAIWWTGTNGKPANRLTVQDDGNVVLYGSQSYYWATWTQVRANIILVVQNDGNLVIYDSSGKAVWSSGTSGKI